MWSSSVIGTEPSLRWESVAMWVKEAYWYGRHLPAHESADLAKVWVQKSDRASL